MPVRILLAASDIGLGELIEQAIRNHPGMELSGVAGTGSEAVRMARRIAPDIVLVGLRLRDGDGAETVGEIMIETPVPTVVVSYGDMSAHGDVTNRALEAGALAVIPAPLMERGGPEPASVRKFVSTIQAMSQVKVVRRWRRPATAAPDGNSLFKEQRPRIVGIVASTGGPAALLAILKRLPADFPAPILIVQHMSSGFVEGAAAYLNESVPLEVKVAKDGAPLQPGTACFAPDRRQMGIAGKSRICVTDDPPVDGFRPSGTYLFESLARVFANQALAVVLTGMGNDGTEGLRAIRMAGGTAIAQDEQSSIVFGMPAAAVAAGLVDHVLPLDAIAGEIVRMTGGR